MLATTETALGMTNGTSENSRVQPDHKSIELPTTPTAGRGRKGASGEGGLGQQQRENEVEPGSYTRANNYNSTSPIHGESYYVVTPPSTPPEEIGNTSSLELNEIFASSTVNNTNRYQKENDKTKGNINSSGKDSHRFTESGSGSRPAGINSVAVHPGLEDEFGKSNITLQSVKSTLNPKYNPILALFVGLVLSSALAIFSAFDAALHCTQGTDVWINDDHDANDANDVRTRWLRKTEEAYYYYNNNNINYYYDNENREIDENTLQQAQNCKKLFTNVLIPVTLIVIGVSIIGCRWTVRDDTEFKMDKKNIPPCIELTGEGSRDMKRYDEFNAYVLNQKNHLYSCYKLVLLSIICFGSWTYAMFMVSGDSDKPINVNDNQGDDDNNLFQLQFQSLGAFNYLGEVGQNANLYYSSWISLILTIALVYELLRITHRQYLSSNNLESELELISRHMVTHTKEIEMVMAWTKSQRNLVRVRRSTWHESLHKLRFRAGFWLVVLIASVIVYCSSSRVWVNLIYPQAVVNNQIADDGTICTIIGGLKARDNMGLLHPTMCQRTLASRATGILCILLSLAALAAHYHFYRLIGKEMESSSIIRHQKENKAQLFEKRKKLMPLRLEFVFAFALTVLLAYNAIFVTAVEGPGSKVGNLYYSSWISFIMSMLIMLGCLEDILDEEDEELLQKQNSSDQPPDRRQLSRWLSVRPLNDHISTRLVMLPSSHDSSGSSDDLTIGSFIGGMPIPTPNGFHQILEEQFVQEEEASRPTRLRRWASSCVFSFLYLVSVLDAAFHVSYDGLDYVQLSMVICPCIMVTFCFIMTCLCVLDYHIVDQFYVGGLVSMFLMTIWVGCLILTLHKESSWAVNEIAEIENANLYYLTWATVLNTGMLSSSYVKPFMKKKFNLKPKGLMVVMWLAVVKICFVMFGSCVDILLTVKDQCKAAEKGDDTDVFCKRTEAGAVFGFLGMAAGFLAAVYRFFFPSPSIKELVAESTMSAMLAVLFAFSLAMVTGIGGPGQAVGDLYYGSWLAFFAALGVAGGLYAEVIKERSKENLLITSDSSTTMGNESGFIAATPYSYWDAAGAKEDSHHSMLS